MSHIQITGYGRCSGWDSQRDGQFRSVVPALQLGDRLNSINSVGLESSGMLSLRCSNQRKRKWIPSRLKTTDVSHGPEKKVLT